MSALIDLSSMSVALGGGGGGFVAAMPRIVDPKHVNETVGPIWTCMCCWSVQLGVSWPELA